MLKKRYGLICYLKAMCTTK